MERDAAITQFAQYLQRRFPERRTVVDYCSDVRQFAATCVKPWRDVTMHDIDGFVDRQRQSGLKPATINRRVAALKTFFDFLAEDSGELQWPNPVRFKRHAGKRGRQLPRDLSDATVAQLWQAITAPRDRAWFVLMWRGGLRVGEVVALQIDALLSPAQGDQPARLRVCGKGRQERIILLSADAYAVLDTWLAARPECGKPHLFLNEHGHPLTANGIEWLLRGYGTAIGQHVTPHQLRHTYARQLTEAGMPLPSLSKLMGHAQITTTQIYTAGADPQLAQAYQTAVAHLAEPAREAPAAPVACAPPLAEPTAPEPPPLPDWAAWGGHLPAAIRQASLDYVQRHLYTWAAPRRRQRALSVLNELALLWAWFLAQRPLTHPGEISLKDLWAYQTAHQAAGHAAGTINRRLDYLLGILRELAEHDLPVDNSVFRLRPLPRPASLPRHLTEAESQRLETFLAQRHTAADPVVRLENACVWLLLHSGLRRGECVDLRWGDLDLAGQRLIVRQGKGQKDRLVYLSHVTCQALHSYLQGAGLHASDPLWRLPNGQPMTDHWLRSHLAAIGRHLQIEPFYPHRLRHTCATRLLNAGMDIVHIQKLLGHEQLSTTMIYARVQNPTVERDYRQAMDQIERRQMPLSDQPIAVIDWPMQPTDAWVELDNSV
jgi:integrase/recombinase XerC